jgi:hypothetical protein
MFLNIMIFYGEELLAPRPTPKLEDHPSSAVRDCLFNVFAATLHTWRPLLHPQPEDVPYRGDRDPCNTEKRGSSIREMVVKNHLMHASNTKFKRNPFSNVKYE